MRRLILEGVSRKGRGAESHPTRFVMEEETPMPASRTVSQSPVILWTGEVHRDVQQEAVSPSHSAARCYMHLV